MESQTHADIEASTQRLLKDLQAVVRDGEELLRAHVNDLTEKGKAARVRLSEALEAARETRRQLQRRAASGAAATRQAILENPYESLGLAFLTGMLVGVLMNRR